MGLDVASPQCSAAFRSSSGEDGISSKAHLLDRPARNPVPITVIAMKILMCPPMYYGAQDGVDPLPVRSWQNDRELAVGQWRGLYRLVRDTMGLEVMLLEPRVGLPDMAFVARSGLVWADKFIPSHFRKPARQPETDAVENFFFVRGYHVHRLPPGCSFEGEGDLVRFGDVLFAGYRSASDRAAHEVLSEILGRDIVPLKLSDDWVYHLGTCLCPLNESSALYYANAFDAESRLILEQRVDRLISVSDEDARRLACNILVAGNHAVMNEGFPEVRSALEGLALSVWELPLDVFTESGGSAKALVLRVDNGA